MEKLNKDLKCPKCAFYPTFNKAWKLDHKDSCTSYGVFKCDWDDATVKDHLHQECPDCGYTIAVPTEDYADLSGKVWATTPITTLGAMGQMKSTVAPLAASAGRGMVTPAPVTYVPPVARAPIGRTLFPIKSTKCNSCPVDKKD